MGKILSFCIGMLVSLIGLAGLFLLIYANVVYGLGVNNFFISSIMALSIGLFSTTLLIGFGIIGVALKIEDNR